ncbi:MAG: hypothetical protein U1F43_02525 [Myxococcota bacterium]
MKVLGLARAVRSIGIAALGLGAGLGVAACGEQAVGGDYQGEALVAIEGTLALSGAGTSGASGELRAALFWARPGGASADGKLFDSVTAVEQEVGAASTFPARYALTVHRPPPDALITTAADVTGRYATAMVLVYLDVDGNKAWDRASEPLVGSARDTVVLFAPDGLTGGRFGVLGKGFHLLRASGASSGVTCGASLAEADPSTVPIVVDMRFPGKALGDLDCDGVIDEWSGTCPALSDVWEECRETGEHDEDGLCSACEGLLWDESPSTEQCDAWLAACEQLTADSHECEEAREHCQGDAAEPCEPNDDDCVPPPG